MNKLHQQDLQKCVRNLPSELMEVMCNSSDIETIFIAGGYIRCIIQNEPVNDIDVNIATSADYPKIKRELQKRLPKHADLQEHETNNAVTLHYFNPVVQVITGWVTDDPWFRVNQLDFSVCGAAFWYDRILGQWNSCCVDNYYQDIAAKRLVYQAPERKEVPGDSILRIYKYVKKGFSISKEELGKVLARFIKTENFDTSLSETDLAACVSKALREDGEYPEGQEIVIAGIEARQELHEQREPNFTADDLPF